MPAHIGCGLFIISFKSLSQSTVLVLVQPRAKSCAACLHWHCPFSGAAPWGWLWVQALPSCAAPGPANQRVLSGSLSPSRIRTFTQPLSTMDSAVSRIVSANDLYSIPCVQNRDPIRE